MKAPRRPRGEKPATTIRWQRRQMDQMVMTIADLRAKLTIAEGKMAEAQDLANKFENEADFLEEQLTNARSRFDNLTAELAETRLQAAYLQGFYDRSPAGIVFAEATAGGREGNPTARTPGEETRPERRAAARNGIHEAPRRNVRGDATLHSDDITGRSPDRETSRTAEEPEWQVGEARDGTLHSRRVNRTYPLIDGPLYSR